MYLQPTYHQPTKLKFRSVFVVVCDQKGYIPSSAKFDQTYSGVGRCVCMEGLHEGIVLSHTMLPLLSVFPGYFVYALWDQVWCKDRIFSSGM